MGHINTGYEKLFNMAKTENQSVTNYRDQLMSRARQRFPDRNFDGMDGQDGQDGQALAQALMEMLDESDGKIKGYVDENNKMLDLFLSDPSSAEFVNRWAETGDPRMALVEVFGDDLAELSSEEGRGKFKEGLASWRKRKNDNDNLNKEAETNWNKSLEDLEAWGNENGLSQEQKVAVLMKLVQITADGLMNKYSAEDFGMALKVMNFDSAVSNARMEGEVAGRNARIREAKRGRANNEALPPSVTGGQGMRIAEAVPERPKSIFSGIK